MSESSNVSTSQASATTATAATPSDTTVHSPPGRAVYVGTTGNLAVRMAGGGSATFVGVAAGSVLPICVDQVLSTNTTASDILLLR